MTFGGAFQPDPSCDAVSQNMSLNGAYLKVAHKGMIQELKSLNTQYLKCRESCHTWNNFLVFIS